MMYRIIHLWLISWENWKFEIHPCLPEVNELMSVALWGNSSIPLTQLITLIRIHDQQMAGNLLMSLLLFSAPLNRGMYWGGVSCILANEFCWFQLSWCWFHFGLTMRGIVPAWIYRFPNLDFGSVDFFYMPVFRQVILWYSAVCPSVRPVVSR